MTLKQFKTNLFGVLSPESCLSPELLKTLYNEVKNQELLQNSEQRTTALVDGPRLSAAVRGTLSLDLDTVSPPPIIIQGPVLRYDLGAAVFLLGLGVDVISILSN